MHSIQILLPLFNENGEEFSNRQFILLKNELTEKFGGITAYTRSPATGFWKDTEDRTVKDDIIIYEVMADELDKAWWQGCRKRLEDLFLQDEIIIRAWAIDKL
ncbi:MAG TPA: hypothetical protein VGB63_00240 [Pedobacter sp.]|jgi:hypothetical protein